MTFVEKLVRGQAELDRMKREIKQITGILLGKDMLPYHDRKRIPAQPTHARPFYPTEEGLLIAGESYEKIAERMRVGEATVARIQRWLTDQFPGFEKAVAEMEKEFQKRNEKKLYATSVLYRLKKKYPLHFLLVPVPKGSKHQYGVYPKRNS